MMFESPNIWPWAWMKRRAKPYKRGGSNPQHGTGGLWVQREVEASCLFCISFLWFARILPQVMAHRIQPWYHPPAMSGFHLSKWYLYCATDAGDASIVYSGDVCWGRLNLHYSSVLESTEGHTSRRSSRFAHSPSPR